MLVPPEQRTLAMWQNDGPLPGNEGQGSRDQKALANVMETIHIREPECCSA